MDRGGAGRLGDIASLANGRAIRKGRRAGNVDLVGQIDGCDQETRYADVLRYPDD